MANSKIKTLRSIVPIVRRLRKRRKKIAFTNGCFDILHRGHVMYLSVARRKGDILIVGLNTDKSIRKIKGPSRPVQPERDRAEILSALQCVDYIVLFNESTPYRLIKAICPDILVKGNDWPVDKIVGGDIVKVHGGKVIRVPLLKGRSTTRILTKIKQL
ncbi:MAG: D-glycero-beta-D-manno-heptose 1-phosphate adenylyltransferase [Candidatus Omnitrophica bacterium]|nr:D-glycero-beta-D-manno-heptose 1-phosphate adenylyltransferase [Candidatus Omnitrophota bacterium]